MSHLLVNLKLSTLCAIFELNLQPPHMFTSAKQPPHTHQNTAKCIIMESEYMTPSEREDHGFAGVSRLDSPRPGV